MSISVGPFDVMDRPGGHHYEDTICEVWNDNHDAEANARLIAAAPALREALEQIGVYGCGMLSMPAAYNNEESWLRRRIAEYERVARAALALADGGDDD